MREPLTGPDRLALKATVVRWARDRRAADAFLLADAFGALMEERDRLAEQRPDLVGLAEIAHAAGVTNAAVANWATRHADFPAPVAVLRCGSVWEWPTIAAWLTEHDMPVHEVAPPASRTRVRRTLEGMGKPFGWFTNQRRATNQQQAEKEPTDD